ncbi:hypothetical protein FRC12_005554 [Ceratobasidium sp. 428]|nr:hypothetical protein FRC12_005554 [Ceratobasidium sp. 428]
MLLTSGNIDEMVIETESGARPESPIIDRFMEQAGLLFNERDASDVETPELLCLLAISGRVEEVIDSGLPALNTLLEQPTEKWSFLVSIGDQYMEALQRFSRLELTNGALKCYYQAISVAPDGALDKPRILGVMGRLHWQRFLKQRDYADIDMAISCLNQAVSGISDGHPNKLLALMDLGVAHREKFAHSKANTDIDLAILYHSQVALSVSDDHQDKPIHISHLGNSHLRRFEHFRDFLDLDKSIACHIEAASMTPDGHPC